jgi:hypothetical protein
LVDVEGVGAKVQHRVADYISEAVHTLSPAGNLLGT